MPTGRRDPQLEGGLSPGVAARVYDRIGKLQDTQSPFERPALDGLISHGRFETAASVFELGCGTGSLATRLLTHHLPPTATYRGVDVSEHMVDLTKRRVASWSQRAEVAQTDGRLPLPAVEHSADRFVAAYVLDLLPYDYAQQVIADAHRILVPDGLICLVSLTEGKSRLAKLVSNSWLSLWRIAPGLVGGCRPIELTRLLDSANWALEVDTVVQSWGVPSQLVVASAEAKC